MFDLEHVLEVAGGLHDDPQREQAVADRSCLFGGRLQGGAVANELETEMQRLDAYVVIAEKH